MNKIAYYEGYMNKEASRTDMYLKTMGRLLQKVKGKDKHFKGAIPIFLDSAKQTFNLPRGHKDISAAAKQLIDMKKKGLNTEVGKMLIDTTDIMSSISRKAEKAKLAEAGSLLK